MGIHQFGPNKDLQLCSSPSILFKWKNDFRSLFSFIHSKDCSGNATFQAMVWDFFLKSWQYYHTGNTVANSVHVLGDLEQELRCQERAALDKCPCAIIQENIPVNGQNPQVWVRKFQVHIYSAPGLSETNHSNPSLGILGSLWDSVSFLMLNVVWHWTLLFAGACKTATGDLVVLGNKL